MTVRLRHIATEPAYLNQIAMNGSSRPQSHVFSSGTEISDDFFTHNPEFVSHRQLKNSESLKGKLGARRRGNDWEIMKGLKENQRCDTKPEMFEGYMMKRRKWPLKGWHKRLFVLDRGVLTYAKTPSEIARGKIYGSIDIAFSVISTKASRRRIDINDEEFIYHLRVKKHPSNPNLKFDEWVSHLCHHRLYRQYELQYGSRDAPRITSPIEDQPMNLSPDINIHRRKLHLRENSTTNITPSVLGRQSIQHGRVAAWVLDSNSIDQCNKDLSNIQQNIFNLGTMLEKLDCMSLQSSETMDLQINDLTNMKKENKKFLRKRNKKKERNSDILKSNKMYIDLEKSFTASSEDITSSNSSNHRMSVDSNLTKLSTSNPLLCNVDNSEMEHSSTSSASTQPSSLPIVSVQDQSQQVSSEFVTIAKQVHMDLRTMVRMIQTERDRLKQAVEKEISSAPSTITSPPHSIVVSLKSSLSQALQQNAELRARLSRIHADSDLGEVITTPPTPVQQQNSTHSNAHECNSVLSSSDYYDATENLSISESSSEGSLSEDEYEEEESVISEQSDIESDFQSKTTSAKDEESSDVICNTGRRSKLPAPKPDTGDFSLWNLLCKNIGKDLSKVSMPVTLNEPLNVLQRLCEELEYSDLLDKANALEDPMERMIYVTAFAVSAYGSSYYRAGHKPFNPLLGETYECVRQDKGFKFISEQVSHHPPVSACYAESENFKFWQDIRIKTKFWGKSMEIQPLGTVNVVLTRWDEHYKWNKVTSCVHNIFNGQRWVDQYGEMSISNSDNTITCNLTFVKASYWSNKRHEIHGSITSHVDGKSVVTHSLFGKWNEALYCGKPPSARCIWRPGAMPEDYELYYGFSRFAIEMNELNVDLVTYLPPTDTRFRPDQRLLEEGNVNDAETIKLQLEQAQRERRKRREDSGSDYQPMWFRKSNDEDKDNWEYNEQYWPKRVNPGFSNITFPITLW